MLRYLFEALYNDGTSLRQSQDDVSSVDPTRSAFFDVDHSKLLHFRLVRQESPVCFYAVDLRDGWFFVNGLPFRMHEYPVTNIRLIFFRRHTHNFNANSDGTPGEETDHRVVYRLGWQGNDYEGKNVQHVMELD